MTTTIPKERAIEIATKRATEDPRGLFQDPFLKSVAKESESGHWIIEFSSLNPAKEEKTLGAMYMFITVDAKTGSIISVDAGGGS